MIYSKILLTIVALLLAGCSTFESFHLKFPFEIAYGDQAVQAAQIADVAKISADKEVMLSARKPHTVEVKLPPEMMPAFEVREVIEEAPPVLAPGASGMATMSDGTTLFDCVDAKGETVLCSRVPAQ